MNIFMKICISVHTSVYAFVYTDLRSFLVFDIVYFIQSMILSLCNLLITSADNVSDILTDISNQKPQQETIPE